MAIRFGRKGEFPTSAIMAILGGGAVAAGVMLTPAGLLEMASTSAGLPSLLPAAAPPLGEKARLILAFASGISAMAIIAAARTALSRLTQGTSVIRIGYEIGYDEEDEPDYGAPSHMDGPRRPLFASSDLEGLSPLVSKPAPAEANGGMRMPLSPEPLDELELREAMIIAPPPRPGPVEASPSKPAIVQDPSGILAAARMQPSDYSALSITELVARFERGLAHRRLLLAEAVAAKRANEAESQAPARPRETARPAPRPEPEPERRSIDAEVDEALRAALGTLQRMTARAA